MSDIPPTIEDDGESDYEQEPFGPENPLTYDEQISKPLDASDNLVWKPMGTDTDPLAFLPGGHREYLLPLPNRGDSIAGALPPEYGSKWPKPGHLFSKQVASHLESPMFKDDRLTLSDEGFKAIKAACEEMQKLVDLGYTAGKQLADGRLMLLKDEMTKMSKDPPKNEAPYESRLHQILAQSWEFALRRDDDLSNLSGGDVPPIPTHSTADLHHFESEYARLDEEGWPGSNSYIQEHARIRLKHSRLTKAEEKACIDMLAADKARIDNMGPPLILTPTPTEEPCWKAPAAKKHHRKYDEWTKEVAPLYLVPHINLQDLGNPDRLMQFITKRASASPMHFLQRDFRSTYLGRALRILTGPFSMHKASWPVLEDNAPLTNTDPTVMYHEYRLKEWERFRLCQVDTATLPVGDAWLGLKAQVITYRFYHRVCLFLLKDAGVKQAKPKADIAPFPGLSKDQKAGKSLIEKDTADANLYLEETSDGTGAGLLFSASFEEHRLEFSNDANTQLEAAVDHIDSLVTTPEYFHRHVQEAYDHHYAHLFPGLITGEDMKKELFVDVLRDVFRKPLMDVELSRYLQLGHDGLYPAVVYKETLFRESEQMLAQNQITFSEHREALETLNRWDSLHCYMLKYRGMMACMQYVSMITNRGIVPASKHLRKYYKRAPRFKAGLGKGNWISGSGVVRYLPKRGSEGRVMKKTRKLRRTMLNFPGLDIELSREGKEAVNTSETIRSIHMLLVEFLGHEELINAIGLGKLLRRINGLAENLRSDDEHCRLIRGPLEDLIQKMSVIFLLIERADAEVPHLANPISSAPDDCANLAKMREYFAHMNWIYPVPVVTRQALRKLDELPIENRVADEVISALFRQHQRWVARRGPANDDARGPGQVPRGVGSPKTASILLKFWCMLFDYVASEKALEDGSYTIRPDMSDLGPSLNETLAQAWPAISGTGSSALGRLGFLGGWGTHDDLYSHIRKPEYETFRKSLTHLTLEKFLEHASGSILDDPALSDVRVGRIKRHVDAYLKSIRGFKPEDTDRGLSSSFAAKDKEVVERWYLERKENCRLAPQNLILSVISGRIVSPLARDCNMEGELLESEDEEEEHGPGWAVGMGGEAGEEVEMEDSPNEEDPVVEDDSENEDEEMREDTGVEEPVVVDEVDDIAMGDAAESKDNVEAVDESIRDMHVDEQREPESAPEPALEPAAEPVPEPVPEPALEPVPEPVPEPAPEPAPKPAPEPAPELAPEPVPEPAPGTPPHPPGSNASTPSPERHRREAVQELENARYAWLQNLDDATWEEVRKKHGGFVDDTTSGRRTKREVPKKEREFYVQKSKPRDEPPPEEETAPKKGQLKRSVFSVIESIYRPTSGYRSAVTLVEMQDFMRAIGFPLRKLGGLEVRYTYDRAAGLIPHGRLARETFVVHQPHGSWGQVYNGPALDAMKKTLLDAGITYELITEFYEERGAGARPARGPVEGPA